jgi:spermidine/putrescine transport system substrate-binding protein
MESGGFKNAVRAGRRLILGYAALAFCLIPAHAGELVLLIWQDYLDPALIAEFEAQEGVRIKQVHFESDTDRNQLLEEKGTDGVDLVLVNALAIAPYRARGWLAPLPESEMPMLAHEDPQWSQRYPESRGYAAPYFWGTVGIAWRADLTDASFDSWMQLFQPGPALAGRIQMSNEAREVVGSALKALGYSANSSESDALDEANELLLAQRPRVRRYAYNGTGADSPLLTGDVAVAMAYNGDALMLARSNPSIRFVTPREGSILWTDFLAITASSRQPALAARFIDFLNQPAKAAQNARFTSYATPNRAAFDLLPTEVQANRAIYPDAQTLARCDPYAALPPRTQRGVNLIFSELLD